MLSCQRVNMCVRRYVGCLPISASSGPCVLWEDDAVLPLKFSRFRRMRRPGALIPLESEVVFVSLLTVEFDLWLPPRSSWKLFICS